MELDEKFFKNYKELIIVVSILFVVLFLCYQPISAAIKKTQRTISEHKTQVEKVKEVKTKVADLEEAKNQLIDKQNKLKPFFEQKGAPEDSIASFGGMFEDIVDYVKMNSLMLRSIGYNLNPKEDPLYTQFPLLYNVCCVHMQVIGTYSQIEGLLKDISVYPYFIDITMISLRPYKQDMQYLIADIDLTLYSKKQKAAAAI